VALLQKVGTAAVRALMENLRGGTPASRTAAAVAILDRMIKGTELLDVIERVEQLEARLGQSGDAA
jgi:hypothetical protein